MSPGRAGVDHQAEAVLGEEVDDQVVDDAAFVEHARVERLARRLQLVDVVGQQAAQERARVGPARSTTHMCETSNMPASARTALCSSIWEP
jgi:hypothetical protein